MIHFLLKENKEITYDQLVNYVSEKVSPFKEILRKDDYSFINIFINEDEKQISLGEVFQLQVNVKNVGTIHFIFLKETFSRKEAIEKIAPLKELDSKDEESAKDKLVKLFEIIKDLNPLFYIYKEYENTLISKEVLISLSHIETPLFIINKEEPKSKPEKEPKIKKEKGEEKGRFFNAKNYIVETWEIIKKNRFHFLLLIVSTVLLQITFPLAILNIIAQNTLYIFLFVCGTIGIAMNTHTYLDLYKEEKLISKMTLLSLIDNVLSIGIGVGVLAIFYNISPHPENDLGFGFYCLIGIGITLGIIVLSILITYLIRLILASKKAK